MPRSGGQVRRGVTYLAEIGHRHLSISCSLVGSAGPLANLFMPPRPWSSRPSPSAVLSGPNPGPTPTGAPWLSHGCGKSRRGHGVPLDSAPRTLVVLVICGRAHQTPTSKRPKTGHLTHPYYPRNRRLGIRGVPSARGSPCATHRILKAKMSRAPALTSLPSYADVVERPGTFGRSDGGLPNTSAQISGLAPNGCPLPTRSMR